MVAQALLLRWERRKKADIGQDGLNCDIPSQQDENRNTSTELSKPGSRDVFCQGPRIGFFAFGVIYNSHIYSVLPSPLCTKAATDDTHVTGHGDATNQVVGWTCPQGWRLPSPDLMHTGKGGRCFRKIELLNDKLRHVQFLNDLPELKSIWIGQHQTWCG